MSKGSSVIPVRFPDELLSEMKRVIAEINARGLDPQYDVSSFIRAAVVERLKHRERSRGPRRRNPPARPQTSN